MTTLASAAPEGSEGSDLLPCPQGCGGSTGDPHGGPCEWCWNRIASFGENWEVADEP